jgi:hypothetical protein
MAFTFESDVMLAVSALVGLIATFIAIVRDTNSRHSLGSATS